MTERTSLGLVNQGIHERGQVRSQELPLAWNHPESPITPAMVNSWVGDVARYAAYNPGSCTILDFMHEGQFDPDLLRRRFETELRYLSRSDAIAGLTQFGEEILTQFSPDRTLFYRPFESASATFCLNNLQVLFPDIARYGVVLDTPKRLEWSRKGGFTGSDISEAEAFVYVDDWVLSGEHLREFLTKDVAGKFHTFHLVMSDVGQDYVAKVPHYITYRYRHTVRASSKTPLFAKVPVCGFHKVPDTIPDYYARSTRHPSYSIFGEDDTGAYVSQHARLVDHRSIFV